MTSRTTVHRLQVADELYRFIEDEVLPATGVDRAAFWAGFDAIVHDLAPKNAALLAERDRLQAEIAAMHAALLERLDNLEEAVTAAVQAYISVREKP